MDKSELIREEQEILDQLIEKMDEELLALNKSLTKAEIARRKARNNSLPEAYGELIAQTDRKKRAGELITEIKSAKNELYDARLDLLDDSSPANPIEHYMVGLHTYWLRETCMKQIILSWTSPVCRPFLLDNTRTEVTVKDPRGDTHFLLKLRRSVTIRFETVRDASHIYPLEGEEDAIYDEFLKELLSRRSEQEFRNIVFSIQKKQGEIISMPFQKNLIVQGCAGSGKSMIMLHRLPIILYDNPRDINRNGLYIITPSQAYIQMATNMLDELEIADLNMGTLQEYYNYSLNKYGLDQKVYGSIASYEPIGLVEERYIYSDKFIDDIRENMLMKIYADSFDTDQYLEHFGIQLTPGRSIFMQSILLEELRKLREVYNANDESLRRFYELMSKCMYSLTGLDDALSREKTNVEGQFGQTIGRCLDELHTAEEMLADSEIAGDEKKHAKWLDRVKKLHVRYDDLEYLWDKFQKNQAHFEEIAEVRRTIKQLRSIVKGYDIRYENMSSSSIYACLEAREAFCELAMSVVNKLLFIGEPYGQYRGRYLKEAKELKSDLQNLKWFDSYIIDKDAWIKMGEAADALTRLNKGIVSIVYKDCMKAIGLEPDKRGRMRYLSCSPYMYLQILYQYQGNANSGNETLITIDEAQNVSRSELELIKNLNNSNVIFNLFGDVKQHIEGTKGIDNWNEINGIADFTIEYINQNYRNARQISDYCKKRFGIAMESINTTGAGVHQIESKESLMKSLDKIFTRPLGMGRSCILVKNREEALSFLDMIPKYISKVHDMTGQPEDLHQSRWNLMTVSQVRGLEFETVFVLSGRMTENEKYIAYTRALSELFIYDEELEFAESMRNSMKERMEKEAPVSEKAERRKRKKRKQAGKNSDKDLILFFEDYGLETIDQREKGGFLWVIGNRSEIQDAIEEAETRYNVSGTYVENGAPGARSGWYTSSKK